MPKRHIGHAPQLAAHVGLQAALVTPTTPPPGVICRPGPYTDDDYAACDPGWGSWQRAAPAAAQPPWAQVPKLAGRGKLQALPPRPVSLLPSLAESQHDAVLLLHFLQPKCDACGREVPDAGAREVIGLAHLLLERLLDDRPLPLACDLPATLVVVSLRLACKVAGTRPRRLMPQRLPAWWQIQREAVRLLGSLQPYREAAVEWRILQMDQTWCDAIELQALQRLDWQLSGEQTAIDGAVARARRRLCDAPGRPHAVAGTTVARRHAWRRLVLAKIADDPAGLG